VLFTFGIFECAYHPPSSPGFSDRLLVIGFSVRRDAVCDMDRPPVICKTQGSILLDIFDPFPLLRFFPTHHPFCPARIFRPRRFDRDANDFLVSIALISRCHLLLLLPVGSSVFLTYRYLSRYIMFPCRIHDPFCF